MCVLSVLLPGLLVPALLTASLSVQYDDDGLSSIQYNGDEFYLSTGTALHRIYLKGQNPDLTYTRIFNYVSPASQVGSGDSITRNYEADENNDGVTDYTISVQIQFEQVGNSLIATWTFFNPIGNPRPIWPDDFRALDIGFKGYAHVNRTEFLLGYVFSLQSTPALELAFEDYSVIFSLPEATPEATYTLNRLDPWEDGTIPLRLSVDFDEANLIQPGESKSVKLQMTFSQDESELQEIRDAAIEELNAIQPMALNWPDRRPIGQLFLGSRAGYHWANNPFGWFNNPDGRRSASDTEPLYVNGSPTAESLQRFQDDLFATADACLENLDLMNAQGIIFWDIEGQQNDHPTTFLGDPRRIVDAPEMEADPDNDGIPIVDEFIQRFKDAGYRVGFTIRPQKLIPNPDYDPASDTLRDRDPYRNDKHIAVEEQLQQLMAKIDYAVDRWGAELIYIDSWPAVNADHLKVITDAYAHILLLPEWSNLDTYAFSAPFRTEINEQFMTPPDVRETYPEAFSVTSFDGTALRMQMYLEMKAKQLQGDTFLFRAWGAGTFKEQLQIDRLFTENNYEKTHPDLEGETVANLLAALDDADKSRVYRAVMELSKIEGNQTVLDRLLQVFQAHTGITETEDWIIARLACEAIGVDGNTRAVPVLQAAAMTDDSEMNETWYRHHEYWAMRALARIGGSENTAFLQQLTESNIPHYSAYALAALAQGENEDSEAILIDRLMHDSEPENRVTAVEELRQYHSDAIKEALLQALWDEDAAVVYEAVWALKDYELDTTALAALYQAHDTIDTFWKVIEVDDLIWRITRKLPKGYKNNKRESWIDTIRAADIYALDIDSWWRHIPREGYAGYRNTRQAFASEPGIGWIYDPYWPYVYNIADHRGQWLWLYQEENANPTDFFAYSYMENSWLWVRGDLGWYYIYQKGIWRQFESDR